jgi:hypothetical protein
MPAAGAGEAVRLDAAAGGRRFPASFDPAVLFEAMERGKSEPALTGRRRAWSGRCVGNGCAVKRVQLERPEDEQVERAFDQGADGIRHG